MRMWMINPKLLCRKHLLGEHGEIHKHRHCFEKQYSIKGRIEPVVQIEPKRMEIRHNDLAAEMLSRGYNHNSPYIQPDLSYLSYDHRYAIVNGINSLRELLIRCSECRKRILSEQKTS